MVVFLDVIGQSAGRLRVYLNRQWFLANLLSKKISFWLHVLPQLIRIIASCVTHTALIDHFIDLIAWMVVINLAFCVTQNDLFLEIDTVRATIKIDWPILIFLRCQLTLIRMFVCVCIAFIVVLVCILLNLEKSAVCSASQLMCHWHRSFTSDRTQSWAKTAIEWVWVFKEWMKF